MSAVCQTCLRGVRGCLPKTRHHSEDGGKQAVSGRLQEGDWSARGPSTLGGSPGPARGPRGWGFPGPWPPCVSASPSGPISLQNPESPPLRPPPPAPSSTHSLPAAPPCLPGVRGPLCPRLLLGASGPPQAEAPRHYSDPASSVLWLDDTDLDCATSDFVASFRSWAWGHQPEPPPHRPSRSQPREAEDTTAILTGTAVLTAFPPRHRALPPYGTKRALPREVIT